MSGNNANRMKGFGVPSAFGNSNLFTQQPAAMGHPPHLLSQSQNQVQGGSQFPGHFQLSEPQAQAIAQAQYAQAHAQAQAAHAQFQAQLQAHSQAQTQSKHLQLQAHSQAQTQSKHLQLQGAVAAGVSSPSLSTPGTGNSKRTHKPSLRAASSSNANVAAPFKTTELTPAARRLKRKIPEKQIPDKVAALLPESALYSQLLEFEARIDAALVRRKIDIQDSIKNPPRVQKTLRIYVFNTFANQMNPVPGKQNADPASWTLRIVGRILENGVDPILGGAIPANSSSQPKFSSFFKKITIYLDQNLYPDNHVILWDNVRSSTPIEGFEVKRNGDKEFTARIRLEINYVPEKFRLSAALVEVLRIEVETRPRILAAIWQYVKLNRLQTLDDPSFFVCDPPLRKVFGEEKMKFSMISQKISPHLSPPQPIHLEHKITLSGNSPVGNTCYDVLVDVPFLLEKEMSTFLANMERNKEIEAYDEAISTAIRKIHEHRRRRAFFLGFSQSPGEFINTVIASQGNDLKLIAGDASHIAEKENHSEFFNQPWAEDAVIRYLNRKSAGTDVPGSAS